MKGLKADSCLDSEVRRLWQSGKVAFNQKMDSESLLVLPLADPACGVVKDPVFNIRCI